MAGDLGCLDGAAADLLPPRDVGAAEGVRSQAGEVATLVLGGLVECVADAGVPERLVMIPLLVKHPGVGLRSVRGGFFAESGGNGSAIDRRTTRHEGYAISQRKRKRIEECFGWLKTIALVRNVRHRGIEKVGWIFTFAAAAYNLVRMRNLLARPVHAA